jgi:hypothetical protein
MLADHDLSLQSVPNIAKRVSHLRTTTVVGPSLIMRGLPGVSQKRWKWPGGSWVGGDDGAFEGEGEGVEGGLPAGDPSCPTAAGGVQ